MLITDIRVENFKSFEKVNAEKFEPLNMIYGENNSGKSNLLQFIELVFRRKRYTKIVEVDGIRRRETIQDSDFWSGPIDDVPYLFFNNNSDKPIKFEVVIQVDKPDIAHYDLLLREGLIKGKHSYEKLILKGLIEYKSVTLAEFSLVEVSTQHAKLFDHSAKKVYFPSITSGPLAGADIKSIYEDILKQFNNSVLLIGSDRYFATEKETKIKVFNSSKDIKKWFFDLYLHDFPMFEKINKTLQEFTASANIKKLTEIFREHPFTTGRFGFTKYEDEELEIMVEKEGGIRLPLSNFGNGIQQLLFIISYLFYYKPKIVLVEELELNLSPLNQLALLKYLERELDKNNYGQIFFTTHSHHFCHLKELISLYEVSIKDGKTNIYKSTKEKTKKYFEIKFGLE